MVGGDQIGWGDGRPTLEPPGLKPRAMVPLKGAREGVGWLFVGWGSIPSPGHTAMAIRILHTADWHLGRTRLGDGIAARNRHEEQERVLGEICRIVEEEKIDLVIHAGDVYDTYNPPAESEELFYRTMVRLADGGRRGIVVVAGNHDSPDRLCASRKLAEELGIVVVGRPEETPTTFDLGDGKVACIASGPSFLRLRLANDATIDIAPIPYVSESRLGRRLVERLDDPDAVENYDRAVAGIAARGVEQFDERNPGIVVAHLYVAGTRKSEKEESDPRLSGSERPGSIGDAYRVSADSFPEQVDYVALGHLHRPQELVGQDPTTIRYAGSPIPYSFSEADDAKSVVVVTFDEESGEDGEKRVETERIELKEGRRLIRKRGLVGLDALEEFLASIDDPDAWISFSVTVESAPKIGYLTDLKQRYPSIIDPRFTVTDTTDTTPDTTPIASLTLQQQFHRFIRTRYDEVPPDEVVDLLLKLDAEGS